MHAADALVLRAVQRALRSAGFRCEAKRTPEDLLASVRADACGVVFEWPVQERERDMLRANAAAFAAAPFVVTLLQNDGEACTRFLDAVAGSAATLPIGRTDLLAAVAAARARRGARG